MSVVQQSDTDDELLSLLLETFNTEQQQKFVKHFQLYLKHGNNNLSYPISLDDVWEYVGFSRRDTAKGFVFKHFKQNIDFVVQTLLHPKMEQKLRGGHNKEIVMMNVATFKTLCMSADTKQAKTTRIYYTTMETIFFQYMEKKHQNTIEKLNLEHQKRHQENLKNTFKDTPCVYLFKVSETDSENFTVKLGETDNISRRMITLKQEYKNCLLLDVFPCNRPHKFEQYLLNRYDIKLQRIPNTELLQIDKQFQYKQLVKIIQKHLPYFNNKCIREELNLAISKENTAIAKEMTFLLQAIQACTDEETKRMFLHRYKQMLDCNTRVSNHINHTYDLDENHHNNDNTKTESTSASSHRKVYRYNPDNLKEPVSEYSSLREAARSLNNNKIHDYHVRAACLDNTLLEGYRWYFIDGDDDLPVELPATKNQNTKKTHKKGLVAQLNIEKTKIINVFPSQVDAAAMLNVAACSITVAITKSSVCAGFYWRMFDECDDALKGSFEGDIPQARTSTTCSKKLQRIDPDTDKVLESYTCIQDVCSIYKTSHKTINKVCKGGDIFKGYKWKLVD